MDGLIDGRTLDGLSVVYSQKRCQLSENPNVITRFRNRESNRRAPITAVQRVSVGFEHGLLLLLPLGDVFFPNVVDAVLKTAGDRLEQDH